MRQVWDLSHIQPESRSVLEGDTIPALFWNAVAQRAVGDLHRVDPEFVEHRVQDREPAGQHRRAVGAQAGNPIGVRFFRLDQQ